MPVQHSRWVGFQKTFGVDLRTLGLFRIGLGSLLIVDLVLRARDLTAHYTDAGVFPREAAIEYLSNWRLSLHLINGTFDFQALLFVIAGCCAFLLAIGWRTRLMTLLSWLMLMSLQNRNPLLLQGGDNLLLMMLFWGMFLPLGARFSVDAALDEEPRWRGNAFFSMATVALLVQFMSVYFFSAFLKSGQEWIPLGSATFLALNTDVMVTTIGVWARQFPLVLQGITYFVWYLELLGPLLIFSPLFFVQTRLSLMTLFILMHVGFLIMLHIGLFPFVSILSLITFTPGRVWDRFERMLRTRERRGVRIYYDRECTFCLKTCRLLREFFLLRDTSISPAQEDPDIHARMQQHDSWVVLDWDGTAFVRWEAVVLIFRRSFWFWPAGAVLDARMLRAPGDWFYGLVSRRRVALGRLTSGILPFRRQLFPQGTAVNVIVGFFALLVFGHNLGTIQEDGWRLPGTLRSGFNALRLDQVWNMFAPRPIRASRWLVAEGETLDGEWIRINSKIELPRRDGEETPSHFEYPNYRWRKFAYRIDTKRYAGQAEYFAAYLCEQANARRTERSKVRQVRLISKSIVTRLEWMSAQTYLLEKEPRSIELLDYDCVKTKVREPEEQ